MNLAKVLFRYGKKILINMLLIVVITISLNYVRSLIPLLISKVFGILGDDTSTLPAFMNDFINSGTSIKEQLLFVFISICLTALVRETFNIMSDLNIAYTSETLGYNMQVDFYDKCQNLPYSTLNHAETGDLIQRSISDVNRVKMFLGNQFPELISCIVRIIIFGTQILLINFKIGGILLICVPILFVQGLLFHKHMKPIYKKIEEDEGKFTTIIQENLTGIRVVKAFANERLELEKFNKQLDTYTTTWNKMMKKMTTYWASGEAIAYLMMFLALILGVLSIHNGTLNFMEVSSLILLIQYIMWPARLLGRIVGQFGRTNIAAGRILEVVDQKSEFDICDGTLTPKIAGGIKFDHVFFKFDDANTDLLEDINFEIKKGQTVAIIGTTGSGKSTLVSLINRMFEPTKGNIYIDGINIKDIKKKYLRKNVSVILQEPFLYSTTIAENIGVCLNGDNQKLVEEVARLASLDNDINRFDAGYNTVVGERGVTLSGGQKQRLSIARAIIEQKKILVFDDSLSAVDTETDIKIRRALSMGEKCTRIIITHRITTAIDSDVIIVMEKGRISEMGTHEELINKPGLYQDIWNIQSKGMEE